MHEVFRYVKPAQVCAFTAHRSFSTSIGIINIPIPQFCQVSARLLCKTFSSDHKTLDTGFLWKHIFLFHLSCKPEELEDASNNSRRLIVFYDTKGKCAFSFWNNGHAD